MLPIKEIAQAQGVDVEEARELLAFFVEYTNDQDLPMLGASLQSGDFAVARQRAHSIKGAALNLKLEEIASYAAQIERKCAASDLEGTEDLLAALTSGLNEVDVWLKQSLSDES
ncbi:MAG: Hpt domain-containing protein [Deltaproteobacteria bacterium]|nr:Hpt domain-containing protein [Deltaproteobacteria bacterium]